MNTIVLVRRLTYIFAMVVLLIPLYYLGKPSVTRPDGERSEGGILAKIRTANNLGQGDLGEVDPASESMRLATLGLRGVAATILWQKAKFYQREEYWDRFSATLNQIAVLEPHFVKVWDFQAHNLAYNVSTEFDDYRQRYQWAKKGMAYLMKGAKFNKRRTEMPYQLGWTFGNKLGKADEKVQFRELFRNDSDFHKEVYRKSGLDLKQRRGQGPDGKPDNWLAGILWYGRAYDMVSHGLKPAKSELMFFRMGPQWHMEYSQAIQAEGILNEPARIAWKQAGNAWKNFGRRQIRTSFGDTIYLTEISVANKAYREELKRFEEFCGTSFEKMHAEKLETLTAEERAAYAKPPQERTLPEAMIAEEADLKLTIDPTELAKRLPAERRVEALQMAKVLQAKKDKIQHIEIYRNQINYGYWEVRCEAEQEDEAILARTSMYNANELLNKGELDAALKEFEAAWEAWAVLFNKHPTMLIDEAADDVAESIERYRRLLDVPDLPDDFALKDFMQFREEHAQGMTDPGMMSMLAEWPKRFPDRNFLKEMLQRSKPNNALIDIGSPDEKESTKENNSEANKPEENASEPDEAKESAPIPAAEKETPPAPPAKPAKPTKPTEAGETKSPLNSSSEPDFKVAPPDSGVPPSPKSN